MQHVLILQHGDYAEAWRRFAEGGAETFREQRISVDLVADLSARFRMTTLSICDRPHREELAPGLWSIGIREETAYAARKFLAILSDLAPDRLILRTPHRGALLWARRKGLSTLPVFADIFAASGLRQRLAQRVLAWALSGPNVPCVANHSLNATLSLRDGLGLPPARLVPWDRAPLIPDPTPKSPTTGPGACRAFYAGTLSEAKGVGDCLAAAALLAGQNFDFEIDLAGGGDPEPWRQRAADLGLGETVRFLGKLPNPEVRARMRAADLVIVPSRHDYAEGLPNTLCEALASRTPVVFSDHPAFASRLQSDRDGVIFRAGDPAALAQAVQRLRATPDLQRRLSESAPEALASLRFGMDWGALIRQYLDDPTDKTDWVAQNSLPRLLARSPDQQS